MNKVIKMILIFLFCQACSSDNDRSNSGIECVDDAIDRILANPPASTRGQIDELLYQEMTIYRINPGGEADFQVAFADEDCNTICVSGGITGGNTDENCPDIDEAVLVRNIFTDDR